jgi:uncharacterized protein (TIGR02145 family)
MKTKNRIRNCSLILVGLVLILINSCKKEEDNSEIKTDITFNPNLTYGTVTDTEGNVYKTIQIDTQTWMAENLRTTKFKDGISIPLISDSIEWEYLTTPAYCWYKNSATTNSATYGAIYNWYTVMTGNLCPAGWHVPSYDEWITLATYLGGPEDAGGKLKETGLAHWNDPNGGATNESGFTALPGGQRRLVNSGQLGLLYLYHREIGMWWSSSISYTEVGWTFRTNWWDSSFSSGNNHANEGFSVRCLKD